MSQPTTTPIELSVSQALRRIATISRLIKAEIELSDYGCVVPKGTWPLGYNSQEDYIHFLQRQKQNILDLIKEKVSLKTVLAASNVKTIIKIDNMEIAVTEALALKAALHGAKTWPIAQAREAASLYRKVSENEHNTVEILTAPTFLSYAKNAIEHHATMLQEIDMALTISNETTFIKQE